MGSASIENIRYKILSTQDHLKRICGIPDSIQWSEEIKIKYNTQILQTIKKLK